MKETKITVLIPTYNAENSISKCIESIQNQDHENIEIVVINDGSSDNTVEICKNLAKHDSRIQIYSKKNGGYGSALNLGIQKTESDFISIVESDDTAAPYMISHLLELSREFETDITRGSFTLIKDGAAEIRTSAHHNLEVFNTRERPHFIMSTPAIWTAIYRRDFLQKNKLKLISYPGSSYEDVDFFIRTAMLANRILCSPESVYNYSLDNPSSSTASTNKAGLIFKNYRITDEFVNQNTSSLSAEIFAQYQKRKTCDFKWHFRRLPPKLRFQFSLTCRNELINYDESRIWDILTKGQRQFLHGIKYYPTLYTIGFNVLNPNAKVSI